MTKSDNLTIGNVIEIDSVDNLTASTINTNATEEATSDDYDAYGAMQFIVATVTVYAAMGVFCILVNNIRKKSSKQTQQIQDDAVLKYLKKEKDLRLAGFHMQLKSLRSKYTEMVLQYEEKMRLIEIRKELETMDTTPPPVKRSRNTRRLSLFNIHSGKKDKFHGKKRSSMDHSIGKMGLSLLHMTYKEEEEEEDGEGEVKIPKFSASDNKLGIIRESETVVNGTGKDLSNECVIDIEGYKPGDDFNGGASETLLPPITSQLSESV